MFQNLIFSAGQFAHRGVDWFVTSAHDLAQSIGSPTPLDSAIDNIQQVAHAENQQARDDLGKQFQQNIDQFTAQVNGRISPETFFGALLLLSSAAIAPKRLIGGAVAGTFMLQFSTTYTGKISAWGRERQNRLPYLAVMGFALMLTKAKGVHPLMQPLFQPLATVVAMTTGYMAAHRIANRTLL